MIAFVSINDMFIAVFTTARHCTWSRNKILVRIRRS